LTPGSYEAPDLDLQLSSEISGSLRCLKVRPFSREGINSYNFQNTFFIKYESAFSLTRKIREDTGCLFIF